jgi:Ca2+-binding EF-hand superfamily protein
MARLLGGLCVVVGFLALLGAAEAEDAGHSKYKGDFETFFKKLDTNRDGKLSKDEFLQMADRAKEKAKAREKLAKVFEMLSPDNKGITKERFKTYLDSKKP